MTKDTAAIYRFRAEEVSNNPTLQSIDQRLKIIYSNRLGSNYRIQSVLQQVIKGENIYQFTYLLQSGKTITFDVVVMPDQQIDILNFSES